MSQRQWTPEQQNAIFARGGTVLVSAAAGSGKTAVLVERFLQRITDPLSPVDADRILVVTFTNAAAAEMRSRISATLQERLYADPKNEALRRCKRLLARAHISTIHSFCAEIAREFFSFLDISPDFTLLSDQEQRLLMADAADEVLEDAFAQKKILHLAGAFAGDREDSGLVEAILDLYTFTRSHPFPEKWLCAQVERLRQTENITQTVWGKYLLVYAGQVLTCMRSLLQNALRLCEEDEIFRQKYAPVLAEDLSRIEILLADAERQDWDTLCLRLREVSGSFARMPAVRGRQDDALKKRITDLRTKVKETVSKELSALFACDSNGCREQLRKTSVLVEEFAAVTTRFAACYDRKKREKRAADFDDLEHFALCLLAKEQDGAPTPSEVALQLQQRFDEIMVDEYQDTNEAQDTLFRLLSRKEENLFFVGDSKQSIYGFRNAVPGIFLGYRDRFFPYRKEQPQFPACIVLDRNFRSRRQVIDTVNTVFCDIMSRQVGDVDYGRQDALTYSADYDSDGDPAYDTEFYFLEKTTGEHSELQEARLIARRISQLIRQGLPVGPKGRQRPVSYGDFCILLRSLKGHAPFYADELRRAGIPVVTDAASSFFEATEVNMVLSFLQVVDNPVQDIPLLTVLLSPLYGFTPDDIARIRLAHPKETLYAALVLSSHSDARYEAMLEDLRAYRVLAVSMTSEMFLDYFYARTGLENIVLAMPEGGMRLKRLRQLKEKAAAFEKTGHHGSSAFVRLLTRLQERGETFEADSDEKKEVCVKIMSIHKSKGLEFPVCILAGLGQQFNTEQADALLHPTLGLGVRLLDDTGTARYTTAVREAIARAQLRDTLSEELRILYVGMTRAREKLLFVSSDRGLPALAARAGATLTSSAQIPPYTVQNVRSASQWLLLCALRHPDGQLLRDMAGVGTEILRPNAVHWHIEQIADIQQVLSSEATVPTPPMQPDAELLYTIRQKNNFFYKDALLNTVPAKVSVSEIARETEYETDTPQRPAFLYEGGLTPSERGTALHTLLQYGDFSLLAADYPAECDRLVHAGYLSTAQRAALPEGQIRTFLKSALFRRLQNADEVHREWRFTVPISAGEIDPTLPAPYAQKPVILQGSVDCVFAENGKLVLLDFKTDHVSDAAVLLARYAKQLSLYAYALRQIDPRPVAEAFLYSFALGREIAVPVANCLL